MKKIILLLSVIIGSLLMQSCICCDHDFWGPGYGHHDYGHYHHGGYYGRPHPSRW